jgi:hypothetical protein
LWGQNYSMHRPRNEDGKTKFINSPENKITHYLFIYGPNG